MNIHYPNPATYRPWLGVEVNEALIELAQYRNNSALDPLSVSDYLEKMVQHWWEREFPGREFPVKTKAYYEDFDFVQSV